MWLFSMAVTNKILPIQAIVLLALFISGAYAIKPLRNQNKTGACTNFEHSASCLLNFSVNTALVRSTDSLAFAQAHKASSVRLQRKATGGCGGEGNTTFVLGQKESKIASGDAEKEGDSTAGEKIKILFQSWENLEEEITGEIRSFIVNLSKC